jgi:hypothetical protein
MVLRVLKMTGQILHNIASDKLIAVHRNAVTQYLELSFYAASAPLDKPLDDDHAAAYQTLPFLIDECQSAYDAIPDDVPDRPSHYLLCTVAAS